jgi:hypothetical protein
MPPLLETGLPAQGNDRVWKAWKAIEAGFSLFTTVSSEFPRG